VNDTLTPTLAVGQQVVLHDVNERKSGGPTYGTIVKIGRVRVDIQYREGWKPEQYRIDDQIICNQRHPGAWFRTLEQEADAEQREADAETLSSFGFRLDRPRPSDDLVHAVAEFLRAQS
jgi:hypothetical protein